MELYTYRYVRPTVDHELVDDPIELFKLVWTNLDFVQTHLKLLDTRMKVISYVIYRPIL